MNACGEAHDVPTLFVGRVGIHTGAAANLTLTIVALAIRQAKQIADRGRSETL